MLNEYNKKYARSIKLQYAYRDGACLPLQWAGKAPGGADKIQNFCKVLYFLIMRFGS